MKYIFGWPVLQFNLMVPLVLLLHEVLKIFGCNRDESLGIKGASCFDIFLRNDSDIPSLALGTLGFANYLDRHIIHFRLGCESTNLHEISWINQIGHALMGRRVHEATSLVARTFEDWKGTHRLSLSPRLSRPATTAAFHRSCVRHAIERVCVCFGVSQITRRVPSFNFSLGPFAATLLAPRAATALPRRRAVPSAAAVAAPADPPNPG